MLSKRSLFVSLCSLHTGGAPSVQRQDPRFDTITKLMASIFKMCVCSCSLLRALRYIARRHAVGTAYRMRFEDLYPAHPPAELHATYGEPQEAAPGGLDGVDDVAAQGCVRTSQSSSCRPVALVVFIDSTFCYVKSGVGMDQYEPTERHMSFCTWTLVPVVPEMLVRLQLRG